MSTPRKAIRNPWIQHYLQWRSANPEKVAAAASVKDVVKMARETYTPSAKPPREKKGFNPWIVHYKKWIEEHPDEFKSLGVAQAAKEAAKTYKKTE